MVVLHVVPVVLGALPAQPEALRRHALHPRLRRRGGREERGDLGPRAVAQAVHGADPKVLSGACLDLRLLLVQLLHRVGGGGVRAGARQVQDGLPLALAGVCDTLTLLDHVGLGARVLAVVHAGRPQDRHLCNRPLHPVHDRPEWGVRHRVHLARCGIHRDPLRLCQLCAPLPLLQPHPDRVALARFQVHHRRLVHRHGEKPRGPAHHTPQRRASQPTFLTPLPPDSVTLVVALNRPKHVRRLPHGPQLGRRLIPPYQHRRCGPTPSHQARCLW
mmetsp:Transcript_24750/g.57368  ORF Transcript_24750/g.57368 Transcript_24750/m.57368 type:complete len:274 (-) Transcript_24750:115-936(-)